MVVAILAGAAALLAAGMTSAQIPGGGIPGGGGRPSAPPSAPEIETTPGQEKPEVAAQKWYKQAVKALKKGMEHDQDAVKAATPDKRASDLEKADDQYSRALDLFTEALSYNADMADAWNSVGFVHLRLGAFRESVDDYDHALKLKPDNPEGIMHRAQAYLHLDRLEDAQAAYMDLFNHSRANADELMISMQSWLTTHRADAQGMRPAQIDAFDAWLHERQALAKQAAS
jgi:tetratricopeptide (TPR) repeat protein